MLRQWATSGHRLPVSRCCAANERKGTHPPWPVDTPLVLVVSQTQNGHATVRPNGGSTVLTAVEPGQALRDDPVLRQLMGTESDTSLLLLNPGPAPPDLRLAMAPCGYSRTMFANTRRVGFHMSGMLVVEGGRYVQSAPIALAPRASSATRTCGWAVSSSVVVSDGVVRRALRRAERHALWGDGANVYYREIANP